MWHLKGFHKIAGHVGCNTARQILKVDITYIKLEEQIPLLGGDLIICTKGQVMDFRALSKIHPLKWNHIQMLVKQSFGLTDRNVCDLTRFLLLCTYSSREDVMGTAVQKVTFADTLICELHPLSRLISCNNPNRGSIRETPRTSSRVGVSAALNATVNAFNSWGKNSKEQCFIY